MKKKVYALLFVMVISLLCTACGKSFTESDYNFNNGAIIYDYDDIPKDYWNALYPEEPNSFEQDYFELEYDAQMSNFEHFAYSLIGFAGETYVDKPNLDVSDLDYKNYQGDYSFNSFRDTTIDVCVDVHPGEWTFSGHGNEVYPIVYYFDSELEYHPITIERVDDIIDTEYFLAELSQLKYVDTYEGWQVYIRSDSNPEELPYAIHLFQQLGKDAIFMIEVDLPYISDDKDFDLNDFYIRLSKLVTLSTEQDYEDVPFAMPTFEKDNESENQTANEALSEEIEGQGTDVKEETLHEETESRDADMTEDMLPEEIRNQDTDIEEVVDVIESTDADESATAELTIPPHELSSIKNALEMEAYSYEIALSVKEQVTEYFNALKAGNIQFLLENNCTNPEDNELVEDFIEMSQYDYASEVTKIFYEDITYDITDNMLKEWAKEIKSFYFAENKEEKTLYLPMLYNLPDTNNWGNLVPLGIKEGSYIPSTDEYLSNNEALSKLVEAKSILPYNTNNMLLVKMTKDSFDVGFFLNSYIEPMKPILNKRITDPFGINEDSPSTFLDKLNLDNDYKYDVENASGLPFGYKHETYTEVIQMLDDKDFAGLEELYLNINSEQNLKYAESMFYNNGKYEDLNEDQKQFIDDFYDTYYEFKIADYAGRSFDGNDIRSGYVYTTYPYVEILKNNLQNNNINYTIEECVENNFKTIHYFPLYSLTLDDIAIENICFSILYDYYTLIGYVKEHIE